MPCKRLAFTAALASLAACGSPPPAAPADARFAAYRDSFHAAAGDGITAELPRESALDAIARDRVLWLGDHHRHARLHALHVELLEQLRRRGAPIALGLEAIGSQDQPFVDAFLAGKIDMPELQRRMRRRWDGSWLDDRELDPWHYRSLLEFARKHALPVFALEPTPRGPLAARDAAIVASVTNALERHPDRLLVVVVGQSHLLGHGDVAGRVGADGEVFGALPSPVLRDAAAQTERGVLLRSTGGVLWFAEMFR